MKSLSKECYESIKSKLYIFAYLVAQEYECSSKIPEAVNDSGWQKFFGRLSKQDYQKTINNAEEMASHCRTSMPRDYETYGSRFIYPEG